MCLFHYYAFSRCSSYRLYIRLTIKNLLNKILKSVCILHFIMSEAGNGCTQSLRTKGYTHRENKETTKTQYTYLGTRSGVKCWLSIQWRNKSSLIPKVEMTVGKAEVREFCQGEWGVAMRWNNTSSSVPQPRGYCKPLNQHSLPAWQCTHSMGVNEPKG